MSIIDLIKAKNSIGMKLLGGVLAGIFMCAVITVSYITSYAQGIEIHYIDVDQGDASLIVCDNEAMLIDGGDSSKSSLIYTYLKDNGVTHLKYIMATHPDADHIGGLAGALNYAGVEIAFCPVIDNNTDAFNSFTKYLSRRGKGITVPKQGDRYRLGSASVEILAPSEHAGTDNNSSIVTKITYGNNSFLFTGDAETEEENSLLSSGMSLKSDVIKVGHHGSASSTGDAFINGAAPSYAVISVGKNNTYGHPADEVLSRLESKGIKVYRTDLNGNIICRSDGTDIVFETEKGFSGNSLLLLDDVESTGNADITRGNSFYETEECYIVNKNTGKFHYPNCNSVRQMKEKNKLEFHGTREEAAAQYSPCGNCRP